MAFPEEFITELKMRNDITDVASGYVNLRRRGRNMVGLCPFHGEKTPSFNIYAENGSFYCFGCGAAGDVISFIMKIENLDYIEAVRFLAQRAGLEIPENNHDSSMSALRKRIYEANREAARFYYKSLYSQAGKQGLAYFYGRGLTDAVIRHFGLGFADDSWDSLCKYLREKGFSQSELVSANLAVSRKDGKGVYDRFRNRVMFPIIDLRGNVIAFGGRIMTDEKPKYLNTSDTPVFKKSDNLFSLNNAKNTGDRALILCEGYMDVIAVNQAGFQNAVATLGTALTGEQAVLMKRYADEVLVCYDADEAGQKATARAIPLLRGAGLNVRVLTVPDGKDPDEFIRSRGDDGPAAFRAVIEGSGNDVDYRLQKLKNEYNAETTDGRVKLLEAAARFIATLQSPIERDVYSSKICAEYSVDKAAFEQQVKRFLSRKRYEDRRKEDRKIRDDLSGRTDKLDSERRTKPRSTAAEEALIAYLVNNPDSYEYINSRIAPESFRNGLMKRYYVYVSQRIASGLDPLNNTAADLTQDERSRLYRIVNGRVDISQTRESLDEYINVIIEENSKPDKASISSMPVDRIMENLERMKNSKR